jgi:hypothetical protein
MGKTEPKMTVKRSQIDSKALYLVHLIKQGFSFSKCALYQLPPQELMLCIELRYLR